MSKYHVGQRLEVTIDRVLSFGVFVRLDDGARAYIRRRELDLDADMNPLQTMQVGQRINAVILKLEEAQKHLELSRRATLDDPWKEYSSQHIKGDMVRGKVRAIHPSGVFIRVAAGVSGFIPLPELAPWEVTRPEDIFWLDDDIEAVITFFEPHTQRLTLSIKERMMQHENALEVYEYFTQQTTSAVVPTPVSLLEDVPMSIDALPAKTIGSVLVVEDDFRVRISLVDWLRHRGLAADQAGSYPTALSKLGHRKFGVIFLDLNLQMDDGLKLIQYIHQDTQPPYICVMSNYYAILEWEDELLSQPIARVFSKPLDMQEIEEFLIGLGNGDIQAIRISSSKPSPNDLSRHNNFGPLSIIPSASRDRLKNSLIHMTSILHAQLGIIFRRDPISQVISILVQSADDNINESAMYQLDESPVKDILEGGIPIFENQVNKGSTARFGKLLNLVIFESCIGVPVPVQDEIHHAVFYFHSDPNFFRRQQLDEAVVGVLQFTVILEQEILSSHLQSLNPLVVSGELTAGLAHEVSNKISSLELQVRNLLPLRLGLDKTETEIQQLLSVILDLKKTTEIFQQLTMAPEIKETFNINTIIEKASTLLRPIAQKEQTKVVVRLDREMPPMEGNSIAIQQAIINLMLNAIQQIALKAIKHNWECTRMLEICTSFDRLNGRVCVRFRDMGPGIHRKLWEKIFLPGFSTRKGSGLGLYIARNFVASLGGTIHVEESFVPLGTTFVIELPYKIHEGAPNE